MLALTHPGMARAADPVAAAVADFENLDTAGESGERTAAHAARVQAFDDRLRDLLAAGGAFRIVRLACPQSPCSPGAVPPAKFLEAARASGARVVVYGRIQKLSTLVQIGVVQALDLETDKLVLDQRITFRGDSDEAFHRAAEFVADYLRKMSFEP
jgi:hypothetical protein